MPMVICLPTKPASSQKKGRTSRYDESIAAAAQQQHAGTLLDVPLYSRIIWFHKYPSTQGDVDNISKCIHDALNGTLYADDRIITHTLAVKVDATHGYDIELDPANPDAATELLRLLDDPSHNDVLYIEVGEQLDTKTRLGPLL